VSALDAAVAVAREHGLPTQDPRIVRDLTNVIVHLAPAPVVARVSLVLASVRDPASLAQQVELAQFLVAAGAPVAAPAEEVDPGPHEHGGLQVTFWRYVEHDRARLDGPAAMRALREVHTALAGYDGVLPSADRLEEVRRVLDAMPPSGYSSEEELNMLRTFARRLEPLEGRPIHGDAHVGNVLCPPDGRQLWTDLENVAAGPVEYDLAAMAYRREPDTDAMLSAYGEYDRATFEAVQPVLALFLATMTTHMALLGRVTKSPEPRVRVERALAYAREM
jgi:hypothetical protein